MISIEIFLALFLFMAIAASCAPRLKLPTEIILLLGSLLISLFPSLPDIMLEPHIVLTLFLPPILFHAAYFTSWRDFKFNLRPISLLAVGLVLFTTAIIGIIIKLLIPDFSWPLSFLLGAIVSPPDAAAATAMTRKLGTPTRLITIIEGESLINDATALTTYRLALAAVMTGYFSFWHAMLNFIAVTLGGILIGYGIGLTWSWLFKQLKEIKAQNVIALIVPYATYLIAEQFSTSGVIATVTTGLYLAQKLPDIMQPEARHTNEVIADINIFLINGLVFTLLGLQLPMVIKGLGNYSFAELAVYAGICSTVVIIIRIIWVFAAAYIPRILSPKLRARDPIASWKHIAILSWTGMRGIVSLAAAMALPNFIGSQQPFPQRHLLIFLTYIVILTTLLLPALTLPGLFRLFNLQDDGLKCREEAEARIAAATAALDALEEFARNNKFPSEIIEYYRQRYLHRITTLQSNLSSQPFSELFTDDQQLRKLLKQLIKIERTIVKNLLRKNLIGNEVFNRLQRELDIEEIRLTSSRLA